MAPSSSVNTDTADRPLLPLGTIPLSPTAAAIPAGILTAGRVSQVAHEDGPEHQYQINQTLLYEHEFQGRTFVSAHLQRLQNGIFANDKLHAKAPMHVTFVALTFTLHPACSASHRFTNAVVEITADDIDNGRHGKPLRFIKYAPHLAYGRISTESLKWSFQLGAALGVTQGPATLGVNSNIKQEREKVVGTMMKIQGSTRSTHVTDSIKHKRLPDTKLVWSLEENDQQETGLPREFTFVFLVERPSKSKAKSRKSGWSSKNSSDAHVNLQKKDVHTKDMAVTESHAHHDADAMAHVDHDATFGPFSLGITVRPYISNVVTNIQFNEAHEVSELDEEVGQRLLPEHTSNAGATGKGRVESFSKFEGYFNFANMKQDFEGLIELPGNAVTTKEPIVNG